MASTYSALKIELITTGEQAGTWGTTTNTNLGTALEEAIVGRATANFTSDANLTISLSSTNTTQVARNYILNVTSTGSLTATRNLIVPSINKPYIIENNTTGGQSIVVKTAAGTGVTVPNGKKTMVYADTTNVVVAEDYKPTLTLGTPLPASSGGTGVSSFGAGVSTWLSTPSSANLADAVTDETGSGALVFATSPTLVTPILGTPTSGNLTNCTNAGSVANALTIGTGLSGTSYNGSAAVTIANTGVLSNIAGTGVSVSGATGDVTITNSAPMTYAGAGIAVSTGTAWTTSLTAPSGTIVGTTDTQTLTGKTISADSNTLSGIAASSFVLSNASGNIDGSAAQKVIPAGVVVGTTDTQTLTNKRVTPRVNASTANSATPTLNTDNFDAMVITGQSVAITSFTTNLTGTPTNGQKLWISITGTTAIAITWGATFESSTVILPTTTVSTNRLDVGFVWNVATSKWRCIGTV